MNTQRMSPYPVDARVRVGEAFGSITAIGKGEHGEPIARPFYHVQFDVSAEGGNTNRIVFHEDILECYAGGMPYLIVLVDLETFARFEADGNMVTFQTVSSKKSGKLEATRGNVLFWRDHYWICASGAWGESEDSERCETNDAFVLTYLEIEMVVPRAEWRGEIRVPHYSHCSNTGYVVIAPEGEFVCTGISAHLAPLPQPRAANLPHGSVFRTDESPESMTAQMQLF